MTKVCSKCNETKDISLFYKRTPYRDTMDGWDYYCKPCRNAAVKTTWNNSKKVCTIENCSHKHYAKGFCKNHYNRHLRRKNKVKK